MMSITFMNSPKDQPPGRDRPPGGLVNEVGMRDDGMTERIRFGRIFTSYRWTATEASPCRTVLLLFIGETS